MAVIECKLISGGELTMERFNKRLYEMDYRITTNTDNEPSILVAISAQGSGPQKLPQIGDAWLHPDPIPSGDPTIDAKSYCHRVTLRHLGPDFPNKWDAHASFSPLENNETPEDRTEPNPLLRPVKYHMESYEEMRKVTHDRFGKLITNAAGDPFDEPLQQEESIAVLVAEKNYASIAEIISLMTTYHGTVNDAPFLGMGPRCARFLPIVSSRVQFENDIQYYTAEIRIAYEPRTWDFEAVNQGFNYFKDINGEKTKVQAVDRTGQPVTVQVLLKEDGYLLPAETEGNKIRSETRVLANFAGIGI